jgi:hypothetical protein
MVVGASLDRRVDTNGYRIIRRNDAIPGNCVCAGIGGRCTAAGAGRHQSQIGRKHIGELVPWVILLIGVAAVRKYY